MIDDKLFKGKDLILVAFSAPLYNSVSRMWYMLKKLS